MQAALDTQPEEKGINVSEKDMEGIHLTRDAFHGAGNDQISPSIKARLD